MDRERGPGARTDIPSVSCQRFSAQDCQSLRRRRGCPVAGASRSAGCRCHKRTRRRSRPVRADRAARVRTPGGPRVSAVAGTIHGLTAGVGGRHRGRPATLCGATLARAGEQGRSRHGSASDAGSSRERGVQTPQDAQPDDAGVAPVGVGVLRGYSRRESPGGVVDVRQSATGFCTIAGRDRRRCHDRIAVRSWACDAAIRREGSARAGDASSLDRATGDRGSRRRETRLETTGTRGGCRCIVAARLVRRRQPLERASDRPPARPRPQAGLALDRRQGHRGRRRLMKKYAQMDPAGIEPTSPRSQRGALPLNHGPVSRRSNFVGTNGAGRDRTDDLLFAGQALSRLSYGPGNQDRQ
jgi:hypothetical protein